MPYFALFYEVVEDYVEHRKPFRAAHLQRARDAHARGELVLGGAFDDPTDGALLVFNVPDEATVERFAREDPYVSGGLVRRWRVKPWHVVVPGPALDGEPGS